jgi:CHASE3 domain sensor protein
MSDLSIFIFGMLVFGVAIGSSLISIIGTSQSEAKVKEGE